LGLQENLLCVSLKVTAGVMGVKPKTSALHKTKQLMIDFENLETVS